MHLIPVLSFVGRSKSGKTTLLEKLISCMAQRGHRLAMVKHTHARNVETDLPGKDSRRFWDAGAAHTVLFASDRLVHTHRYATEPVLDEVLAGIGGVDLVLVEGYKHGNLPKIEVVRAARDPVLIPGLEGRVACVTDVHNLGYEGPCFDFDAVEALADFIETFM